MSARICVNSGAGPAARVMTMVLPKSGRVSNQRSFLRSLTTAPMMTRTGEASPASRALTAMSASVPSTDFWRGVLPHWTAIAGKRASQR